MNLYIQNVSKQGNHDFWGLKDFYLELGVSVLGLLGPNEAGKSKLMRILPSIMDKTEGVVTSNGVDIAKHSHEQRKVIGSAAGF